MKHLLDPASCARGRGNNRDKGLFSIFLLSCSFFPGFLVWLLPSEQPALIFPHQLSPGTSGHATLGCENWGSGDFGVIGACACVCVLICLNGSRTLRIQGVRYVLGEEMGLPGWYEFMTSMAEIYFQTKVSTGCVSMWVHREMSRMLFFQARVCKSVQGELI